MRLRTDSTSTCPLQRMITTTVHDTTHQPISLVVIVRTRETVMVILLITMVNCVRLSPCLQCLLLIPLMHQTRAVGCRGERGWRLLHHLLGLLGDKRSQRDLHHITRCWHRHSRGTSTLKATLLKAALGPKRAPRPYRTVVLVHQGQVLEQRCSLGLMLVKGGRLARNSRHC